MSYTNHKREAWKRLLAVGLLVGALLLGAAIVGSVVVGAQSTSPVAEVPGLDAGETGNITVEVAWNSNATTSDTATVEIDYVTNATTGTLEQTDTHTINASPANTTTDTFEVVPDQDVSHFEVTTEAVQQNVSSVNVTSDITASGGGAPASSSSGESTGILGGLVVAVVLVGGIVWKRRQ